MYGTEEGPEMAIFAKLVQRSNKSNFKLEIYFYLGYIKVVPFRIKTMHFFDYFWNILLATYSSLLDQWWLVALHLVQVNI